MFATRLDNRHSGSAFDGGLSEHWHALSIAGPGDALSQANFPNVIDLANLDPALGFTIAGYFDGGRAGFSVDILGDVNGDGYADMIIGAPYFGGLPIRQGRAFVVFGKEGGFDPVVDLGTMSRPAEGFFILEPSASGTATSR
jgi:hypothetical protein